MTLLRNAALVVSLLLSAAAAEVPGQAMQPGDRVVWLGDDLTQQMFFTRATATCLMSLRPGDKLRFCNGGRDGSTSGDAVEWCVPLLQRVEPTVVVVCFGLNDLTLSDTDRFELELTNLVASVRRQPTVRDLIVLSPPALPREADSKMADFVAVSRQVAQREKARFIDIHSPMAAIYRRADDAAMAKLTLGERLPGEGLHMVIASHVLAALGVSGEQAASVSWSPLPPMKMGAIRPDLAWAKSPDAPPPPAIPDAAASRRLYLTLTACDELFFRVWRLDSREDQPAWSAAWSDADVQAGVFTAAAIP